MIFTEHLANHLGALRVGAIVQQAQPAHGIQHAAVGGFQAVPRVRQRAADDDRHRIIDVGPLHLIA